MTDCDVKPYDIDPNTKVKTFNEKRAESREAETEKNQKYTNKDYPHKNKIDITIVVDMLLTGFDSIIVNEVIV